MGDKTCDGPWQVEDDDGDDGGIRNAPASPCAQALRPWCSRRLRAAPIWPSLRGCRSRSRLVGVVGSRREEAATGPRQHSPRRLALVVALLPHPSINYPRPHPSTHARFHDSSTTTFVCLQRRIHACSSSSSPPRPSIAAFPEYLLRGCLVAAPLHHRAVHCQSAACLARYTPSTPRHATLHHRLNTPPPRTTTLRPAARTCPPWITTTAPSAPHTTKWTLTD